MGSNRIVGLLWILLLCGALTAVRAHASDSCVSDAYAALDSQWHTAFGPDAKVEGPGNIETIERKALAEIAKCTHCPQKPFGYQYAQWEQFKRLIQPGDCVVFFRSNPASWKSLSGREGYALIRNGQIVQTLITLMS